MISSFKVEYLCQFNLKLEDHVTVIHSKTEQMFK